MIIKKAIKSTEIDFLLNEKAIYTCDFRAIGESMEYSISAMWKYENLLPWILKYQAVVVNSDFKKLNYPYKNTIIEIEKTTDPKISIYNRLNKVNINKKIIQLYVAIPHPEADLLAKDNDLIINYSYADFLKRNDKFKQKELFGECSPNWQKIDSSAKLTKIIIENKTGFIKRRHGSGGYTIFDIREIENNNKFNELFNESPKNWYFETNIKGKSYSIQCLKYRRSDDIILFGFSEQIISEEKYFSGSYIFSLDNLSETIFKQLTDAINKIKPILDEFEGFFGVDFIIDKNNKVSVLEANIRLTAATVPTLLFNSSKVLSVNYYEDVEVEKIPKDSMIIGYDTNDNLMDIVDIKKKKYYL